MKRGHSIFRTVHKYSVVQNIHSVLSCCQVINIIFELISCTSDFSNKNNCTHWLNVVLEFVKPTLAYGNDCHLRCPMQVIGEMCQGHEVK